MKKEFSLVTLTYKSNKGNIKHQIECFKVGNFSWTEQFLVCVTHTDYFNPTFKYTAKDIKDLLYFVYRPLFEKCISLKNKHRKYSFTLVSKNQFEREKGYISLRKFTPSNRFGVFPI